MPRDRDGNVARGGGEVGSACCRGWEGPRGVAWDFEATLYGAESHYRDHVTHPVYVWLLGLRFLDERVNDRLEKMLAQFGHIGFARSTFQFASQHDHLVQQLLSIIGASLVPAGRERWRTRLRPKYQAKFARSWEAFNHGIVSSLILLRTLTYFLETDVTLGRQKCLSNEDARQFAIRSEILHSIAAHTIERVYHLSAFTLPFLLVLCDDLQEWGRPTMGDLQAGDLTGSAHEVRVKVEVIDEKTVIECAIKHGKCDYGVQHAHALRAFRTWHERLRPALDDRKRNMRLEWELQFEGHVPWSLTIDTSADVFQMVNATGPKEKTPLEEEDLALY